MKNEFDANVALACKSDAPWMRPAPVRRRDAGVTGVAMVVVCALVAFVVRVLS